MRWRALTASAAAVALLLHPGLATGEPVRMRYPEGPSHGFLVLSEGERTIAHGELIQWLERRVIASRLIFRFDDGSLYDEVVRFTQQPVFRIQSYHLVQRGPSFKSATEVEFDRSGKYRATVKAADKEEERDSGTIEVPEDVSNGLTSVLLKNLKPGASAKANLLAFRPKPVALELELAPEGSDPYRVGSAEASATRFLMTPRVRGLSGVVATLAGKQPEPFRMWIAQGDAPVLVRFEGPLYLDGPQWRIELGAPRWKK
jgi:hypothetical protein